MNLNDHHHHHKKKKKKKKQCSIFEKIEHKGLVICVRIPKIEPFSNRKMEVAGENGKCSYGERKRKTGYFIEFSHLEIHRIWIQSENMYVLKGRGRITFRNASVSQRLTVVIMFFFFFFFEYTWRTKT